MNRVAESEAYREVAEGLPFEDSFLIHAASFSVDGKGILLLGPSGIGKTTHMKVWEQILKDRFAIINDDKPILKMRDGHVYIISSPLCGKENFRSDNSAELYSVIILDGEKDYENASIEKLDNKSAAEEILKQVYIPRDKAALEKTLDLVNSAFKDIPLYLLKRNRTIDCAHLAIKEVLG